MLLKGLKRAISEPFIGIFHAIHTNPNEMHVSFQFGGKSFIDFVRMGSKAYGQLCAFGRVLA